MFAFKVGILSLLLGAASAKAQNAPSNTSPLDFDLPSAARTAPSGSDFVQSLEKDLGRSPDPLTDERTPQEDASSTRHPSSEEGGPVEDLEVEKMTFVDGVDKASEPAPVNAAQRKELVLKTISKYYPTLKKCYVDGLKESPKMKGKVTLAWGLDTRGRVLEPEIQDSQLKNKKVENCLVNRFGEAHFPPQTKLAGSKDRMTYTLQFLPENI